MTSVTVHCHRSIHYWTVLADQEHTAKRKPYANLWRRTIGVFPDRRMTGWTTTRTPGRRRARCWNWKKVEVKWALSAPEALSRVESFTPRDVALIDITMPGTPGNFIEGRK